MLVLMVVGLLPSVCFGGSEVHLGMRLAAFKKRFPGVSVESSGKHEAAALRDQTLHGLEGQWRYHFKRGVLKRYGWGASVKRAARHGTQINKKNFRLFLAVTRKLMAELQKRLGKPAETRKGSQRFRSPYKQRRWRHGQLDRVVLRGKWKKAGKSTVVDFTFRGEKAQYAFVLQLWHRAD